MEQLSECKFGISVVASARKFHNNAISVRTIEALEQTSELTKTVMSNSYPLYINNSYLSHFIQEIIAMQVQNRKLSYGGIDGTALTYFANMGLSVPKGMNLYEALKWVLNIVYLANPGYTGRELELPKNKYLTICDSEIPNIGKLWWKYVPTASDSKWVGVTQGTYGKNVGQQIRYGKNISGITREIDESEIYTALIPTGKNGMRLNQLNNSNIIGEYVNNATEIWTVYKTEGSYSCIRMPSYADGVYGAYAWTAEGAALPTDIKNICDGASYYGTDIKSSSIQGEDERSIKVLTSLLPSGSAVVVYLPQPYLKNWNQIPIYGTRMKTFAMPACYNFEVLKSMASKILVDMSCPRYAYRIDATDFYDDINVNFNLIEVGSIVKVIDEEMGVDVSTYVLSKEKRIDERGSMIIELENRTRDWQATYDRYQYLYDLSIALTTPSGRRTNDYWSKVMGYAYISPGWTTITHRMIDGSAGGIDIEGIDPNDKPKAYIGLFKFRMSLASSGNTLWGHGISKVALFYSIINVGEVENDGAGFFVETEQRIGFPYNGNGHYNVDFRIYSSSSTIVRIQEIQVGVRALW